LVRKAIPPPSIRPRGRSRPRPPPGANRGTPPSLGAPPFGRPSPCSPPCVPRFLKTRRRSSPAVARSGQLRTASPRGFGESSNIFSGIAPTPPPDRSPGPAPPLLCVCFSGPIVSVGLSAIRPAPPETITNGTPRPPPCPWGRTGRSETAGPPARPTASKVVGSAQRGGRACPVQKRV